jgi:hypothetical protein
MPAPGGRIFYWLAGERLKGFAAGGHAEAGRGTKSPINWTRSR